MPSTGDYIRADVGRESFIIVRIATDELRAFYNVCPHRGNPIVQNDFGTAQTFTCSFHSWRFAMDGTLLKVTDEETFDQRAICDRPGLSKVRVETLAGMIFINMDEQAPSLMDYLGPIAKLLLPYNIERFHVAHDMVQSWDANWKTGLDPFIEAYHAHSVHADLSGFADDRCTQYDCYRNGHGRVSTPLYMASSRHQPPAELSAELRGTLAQLGADPATYHGPVHNIRAVVPQLKREWAQRNGLDFSGLTDGQLVNNATYYIFPNFAVYATGETLVLQHWRPHPSDPEKFDYHVIFLIPPAQAVAAGVTAPSDQQTTAKAARPQRIKSDKSMDLGPILNQDREQIHRHQQGLRSRAFKGFRLSGQEVLIRHYHTEIDRYLASP
jgi:phenylpropionate dioxygenase-like ring-hydroxylating dioxygenase large terminal subunit